MTDDTLYKWVVLAVCVITFMLVVASQLASVSPTIPVFMEVFNISATVAGLLTSMWALARVVMALPAGGIATRFGSRLTYIFGVTTSAIGWFVISLAPNYSVVLIGRFLMGLGAGTMSVAGPIIISEWFPKNRLGTAMSFWTVAMPLGILWELPLIALMISLWGWRHTFTLFAVLSSVMIIPLAITLRREPPNPLRPPSTLGSLKFTELLSNKAYVLASLSIFFSLGMWGVYSTYIVKWCMVKGYDYITASMLGTLFNVGCVSSQLISGYVSDKFFNEDQRPTFIFGTTLASILSIVFAYTSQDITTTLTVLFMGVGVAPITVAMFVIPISMAKPELRGLAMGFTGIFIYSSYILSLLAGYVYDTYGLVMACIATAVLGFTGMLIMLLGVRGRKT